jgi:hypothetical protein
VKPKSVGELAADLGSPKGIYLCSLSGTNCPVPSVTECQVAIKAPIAYAYKPFHGSLQPHYKA